MTGLSAPMFSHLRWRLQLRGVARLQTRIDEFDRLQRG